MRRPTDYTAEIGERPAGGEPRQTICRKSEALPKAKSAAIPPIKDIEIPGGNSVSLKQPRCLSIARPNGLRVMPGSEWPEFNQVLLETTLATIPNNPDAEPNRVAAASAALAAFKPTDEIEGMIAAQGVAITIRQWSVSAGLCCRSRSCTKAPNFRCWDR